MNKFADSVSSSKMPISAVEALLKLSKCKCGCDLIIDSNLIGLYCSDPACKINLAKRIESMFKVLKVPNFGEANCIDLVLENDLEYLHEIWTLDPQNMPSRYKLETQISLYEPLFSDEVLEKKLSVVLRSMKLMMLDKSAEELAGNYTSIAELYKDMFNEDKYGVTYTELGLREVSKEQQSDALRFIAKQLNTSIGVKAQVIMNEFVKHEYDIKRMCSIFKAPVQMDNKLKLAITNELAFGRKAAYVAYLNEILEEINTEVQWVEKYSKKAAVTFLISQNVNGTSKQLKDAVKAGESIKIAGPDLVINYCKNLVINIKFNKGLSEYELKFNLYSSETGELLEEDKYATTLYCVTV